MKQFVGIDPLLLCITVENISVHCYLLKIAKGPQFKPKNLFPLLLSQLLHLTCGARAVDNKDLTVSSDQGNA